MNKCLFIGRLTRDPDTIQTNSGMLIVKFTLAVDQGYGENKKTAFCDITTFKKSAEYVRNYCQKGNLLGVECQVTQESWQDRTTGQNRSKIAFIGDRIENLTPRNDSGQAPATNYQQPTTQAPAPPAPPPFPSQAPGAPQGTPAVQGHAPQPGASTPGHANHQPPVVTTSAHDPNTFDVSDESINDIPF